MDPVVFNTWDQLAPRSYVHKCYCFPYRDQHADIQALEAYLVLALEQLSLTFPYLKQKITLLSNPKGRVAIQGHLPEVPLQVLDQRDSFPWTYDELKAQGFPAKAFVNPSFCFSHSLQEDGEGAPILVVRARIIRGGLLLFLYTHHTITDGTGMDNLASCFADLTRDPTNHLRGRYPVNLQPDLPKTVVQNGHQSEEVQSMLDACPELCNLSAPEGPLKYRPQPTGIPIEKIEKTGRIFVMGRAKIAHLKKNISQRLPGRSPPSTFTCLVALIWSHATKARLKARDTIREVYYTSESRPERTRLMLCVNWLQRAFTESMGPGASNKVALPTTTFDTITTFAASSRDPETSYTALAQIVQVVESCIGQVNEDFVSRRTALYRAVSDPRLVGIDMDAREPSDFVVNTWRPYLPQTRWKFPGLVEDGADGAAMPDVVRRAQPEWNMGAGLILPSGKNAGDFEILVTLDKESMDNLCSDPSWMACIDRVVE